VPPSRLLSAPDGGGGGGGGGADEGWDDDERRASYEMVALEDHPLCGFVRSLLGTVAAPLGWGFAATPQVIPAAHHHPARNTAVAAAAAGAGGELALSVEGAVGMLVRLFAGGLAHRESARPDELVVGHVLRCCVDTSARLSVGGVPLGRADAPAGLEEDEEEEEPAAAAAAEFEFWVNSAAFQRYLEGVAGEVELPGAQWSAACLPACPARTVSASIVRATASV
jgi:hypothetical protein